MKKLLFIGLLASFTTFSQTNVKKNYIAPYFQGSVKVKDTLGVENKLLVDTIRGFSSSAIRSINTTKLQFAPTQGLSHSEGLIFYDSTTKTFSGFIDRPDVTLNIGEEQWLRVVNKSGDNFVDGQVVYLSGAQGNRPTVLLAQSDSLITSQATIAVLTEDVDNNEEGIATTFGLVRNFDTRGFTAGDELFLSATDSGEIVNTKPTAPDNIIRIGWALNSTANGIIFVNINAFGDGSNNTFIDQDVSSGSSPTWNAATLIPGSAINALTITQTNNADGINIVCDATTNYAISAIGKFGFEFSQYLSDGQGLYINRNNNDAETLPLVTFTNDHASDTKPTLQLQNDGSGVHITTGATNEDLEIDPNGTGEVSITGNLLVSDNVKGDTAKFLNYSGQSDFSIGKTGDNVTIGADTVIINGNMVTGVGAAGVDYRIDFDGETNDGSIIYMEDEDRFDFDNDIKLSGNLIVAEITTPSTITDFGQYYTKSDDVPYFKDGAGTEHTLLTGSSSIQHEFFPPVEDATGTVGNWDIVEINAAQQVHFNFQIPEDFEVLDAINIVIIPDASETIEWDIFVSVSAAGEAYNNDDRTTAGATLAVTINLITEVDISGDFGTIAAGDYIAIDFQSNTANLRIIGLEFDFN